MFKRRKKASKDPDSTLIFFCTDIHGSDVCFKKFINAANFYGTDVLILGGDVTGKMVVPIARQSNGRYLTTFADRAMEFESEEELADFLKRARNMGFYPKVMDEAEFQELKSSPQGQERLFRELISERLEEWMSYAEEKLGGTDVRVFAAPGNDDFFEVDEILASGLVTMLEGQVYRLTDDHEILTTGWTNPTPWDTERECSEEELKDRILPMIDKVEDMERCIFNIHVPPHDTKIDVCPQLDENLKVIYNMGNPVHAPVGSTTVRELIESYQPMLGLHGHIHEGRGEARLGRTLCINPGSVYSEGVLNGVLVRVAKEGVTEYQFTQG